MATVLCALSLAACSGGGPGPAAGPPAASAAPPPATATVEGPCGWLTSQEYNAIVGRPITAYRPSVDFSGPGCEWSDEQGGVVEVTRMTADEYRFTPSGTAERGIVAGLGDEAFLGSYDRVLVKKGKTYFLVGSQSAPAADGRVSPVVRTAGGAGLTTEDLLNWETSYRIATLVIDRL